MPMDLGSPPPLISPEIGPDMRNANCTYEFEKVPYCCDKKTGVIYDFAFGFRIQVPAVTGHYLVRAYDRVSGMLLDEVSMGPGARAVSNRKYFVSYRIEVYRDGVRIFEHEYDCRGKRVYIIIPDGGLGENLAWLPYIELFQKTYGAKVTAVVSEWMIRLVKEQYPNLEFLSSSGRVPQLKGAYANYFCTVTSAGTVNWRPVSYQQFGMLGSIAAILGVSNEPIPCRLRLGSKRQIEEPYVCIGSMPTSPCKYWNYPNGWNEVIRFLKSNGYRVFDIDRDRELRFGPYAYSIPSEAEDRTGAIALQERIDLLEHADFFIGLPSGLSWLAWDVGIPVVMLSGFSLPGSEFPTPYRVSNLLFCHGCWNDVRTVFDMNAAVWCPRQLGTPRELECTKSITPKMVIDTIQRIPAFQRRCGNRPHSANSDGQLGSARDPLR